MKTCIIAPHEIARERLRRELAITEPHPQPRSYAEANPDFYVVSPGDMRCAHMFDDVVVTPEANALITGCERHQQWFAICIRSRMTREAQLIILND